MQELCFAEHYSIVTTVPTRMDHTVEFRDLTLGRATFIIWEAPTPPHLIATLELFVSADAMQSRSSYT